MSRIAYHRPMIHEICNTFTDVLTEVMDLTTGVESFVEERRRWADFADVVDEYLALSIAADPDTLKDIRVELADKICEFCVETIRQWAHEQMNDFSTWNANLLAWNAIRDVATALHEAARQML
jgi:hypothetical protein